MVEIQYVRCLLCGWQKPFQRNRRPGEPGISDKIRYQFAVNDDGSALITLRQSHPVEKGKKKGSGGFTNSGRLSMAEVKRDPQYAELIEDLRKAVNKIKRELG